MGSGKPSEDDPLVKNSTDDVMDQAQISESSNNPMTLEQVNIPRKWLAFIVVSLEVI